MKKVSGSVKYCRLLADMCIRKIRVYITGQLTRLINGVINYCDIHVVLPFYI